MHSYRPSSLARSSLDCRRSRSGGGALWVAAQPGRRLVDVDLLGQAGELLKYQADNRLDGVPKAQVATDLAVIYLMDRQPEPALQAIWTSRTTILPSALNTERRALEARALMELGRFDHALEVLGADASPEAREVRAEVFWKQQNWAQAGALYEGLLGDRHRDPAALTAAQEARLIRAGVGYSLVPFRYASPGSLEIVDLCW